MWQEHRGRRTVIVGVLSRDSGRTWSLAHVLSDTEASAAYPRVVATDSGFRVFWTESEDGARHTWNHTLFGSVGD